MIAVRHTGSTLMEARHESCQHPDPVVPGGVQRVSTAGATRARGASHPHDAHHAVGRRTDPHAAVTAAHLPGTPEDQAGQVLAGTRAAAADGVDISGIHAGQSFLLRVRQGDCSDGMSDNRYPMTAEFEIGGEFLKGCADGDE